MKLLFLLFICNPISFSANENFIGSVNNQQDSKSSSVNKLVGVWYSSKGDVDVIAMNDGGCLWLSFNMDSTYTKASDSLGINVWEKGKWIYDKYGLGLAEYMVDQDKNGKYYYSYHNEVTKLTDTTLVIRIKGRDEIYHLYFKKVK